MKLFLMWEVPFLVHIKTSKFIFPTLAAAGIGEGSTAKKPFCSAEHLLLKIVPSRDAGRQMCLRLCWPNDQLQEF